jgi:hypothetical protein
MLHEVHCEGFSPAAISKQRISYRLLCFVSNTYLIFTVYQLLEFHLKFSMKGMIVFNLSFPFLKAKKEQKTFSGLQGNLLFRWRFKTTAVNFAYAVGRFVVLIFNALITAIAAQPRKSLQCE